MKVGYIIYQCMQIKLNDFYVLLIYKDAIFDIDN